ncbi:MFS transporter [Halosegnis sp.]|uniref:MFS transporter n=1 Tax=Halosegnis sp. TaxID=2864959 RepID=UPI0035D44689
MLGSLVVAWATLQTGRFLLSPLLPSIIDSLAITKVTAGFALGALQFTYALTQYPSGRLSDALSRASLLLPGFVTLVAAFLLLGTAGGYAVFVLAALLIGVGKGLFAIPSRALVSDLFVERRGQAFGLYTAGTDVGGTLAAAAAFLVVGGGATLVTGPAGDWLLAAGWRAPFAPVAAVLAGAGLLYLGWSREPFRFGRPSIGLAATLRRLATTREQRATLAAFALFYFMVGAWINFLPTYLAEAKGLAAPLPQLLFAVVFIVGLAVKPAAGAVSDRFPRRLVGAAGLGLAVLALVAVTLAVSVPGIAAAVALFAAGYKAQFPVVDAVLLDAAPSANAGGDLGAARALFIGVGALGPVYMGAVASTLGYGAALAGLVGCLVVAGLLLVVETRR